MVFGSVISSPRGGLSPQQLLELANVYLENASKVNDSTIALVLCYDTEVSLGQVKKAAKNVEDQALRERIATTFIGLGRLLDSQGYRDEALAFYKKSEKWGGHVQDPGQPTPPSHPNNIVQSNKVTSIPSMDAMVANTSSTPSANQLNNRRDIATIAPHIFVENVRPPSIEFKLPEPDERLTSTPQLACCLSLLKMSQSLDTTLEPVARNWLQAIEKDTDEKHRLEILVTDVIIAFKRDEIKDAKAVAEVAYLAPVLEKDNFRYLLEQFYSGIENSGLLDFQQLQGLAQLIQGADPDYLDADDLVKTLKLLNERLGDTHDQSQHHIYQLTLTVSHVLDAMADTNVKGLDREKLHEPLSSYLEKLKNSPDPYLVYQAAYAYQALLCVPDNESIWQATMRRTGKVVKGVSGLVSAVKGLDLNKFIEGLTEIQKGLSGVSQVIEVVKDAYDGVAALSKSGQNFLECLKEGLSFDRKGAWYSALRGADVLIRDGELASFRKLVCEAPCRRDPAFQWGVCQRLGDVAANPMWDPDTRRSAIAFLGFCRDKIKRILGRVLSNGRIFRVEDGHKRASIV
ncbi:hypothetical protein BGZ65_003539 [Modicella reniformis]|uniref:Arm-like repeat domain-containing protein n=1 Tax=Modicella reniformis TaxID=1440133 RepID=A0A9P6ML74_9FUNG|nr:hypothetical protein BGZ65_003539 [Modicella reniformis]